MGNNELTDMQEKFCQEYAKSGHATQSAINAGYSARSADVQGSRLSKQVKIRKRIAEIRAEEGIEINTERDNVLEMLYNIMDDPKSETQHKLKAIEMISKIEGYYKDTPEINVDNTVNTFDPSAMSDEELEQKMRELDTELRLIDGNG